MPLDLEELWVGDAAGIRITTNEAAHLTLRYTYTEPVKTSIPKEKRGATWYYDNKMCFVAWKECVQDEAGDTLVHTFSCPIFPTCVKVWYIFTGTIGGAPSPSNTAIFEAHMTWPPPTPPAPALAPRIDASFCLCITPDTRGGPTFQAIGVEGSIKSPALDTPTKTLTI